LPGQVTDGMAPYYPLTAIDGERPNYDFKILYCAATLG
jgi:hypothetical protein